MDFNQITSNYIEFVLNCLYLFIHCFVGPAGQGANSTCVRNRGADCSIWRRKSNNPFENLMRRESTKPFSNSCRGKSTNLNKCLVNPCAQVDQSLRRLNGP